MAGVTSVHALAKAKLGRDLSRDDPSRIFELLELLGKGSFGSVYRARKYAKADVSVGAHFSR